ncbi:iron-sulfur cluster assembly protein [Hyperthermus butylicus]|uniref:Uncharacterized protein n=1 Tax=Hyperthermus butylicus (strain DSM 5456 / JCM 9403 / PLM1-5) TaxID=415426 RepID=A2BLM5_HYPBU|nr:iron-sulfur cluster assembly protein [Hyperthermus butylicus]ABM80886.1 hypothetical protein Hbut_1042 [Hyperthermus butylicus DSM 5456]
MPLFSWLSKITSRNEHQQESQKQPKAELAPIFHRAESVLRQVIVPGFDADIVSLGVVRKLRLSGDTLVVFVDYTGTDPSCFFCRFINNQLWRTILSKAKSALHEAGFDKVVFIDYRTGLEIEL